MTITYDALESCQAQRSVFLRSGEALDTSKIGRQVFERCQNDNRKQRSEDMSYQLVQQAGATIRARYVV
jgi:hypothetical protein